MTIIKARLKDQVLTMFETPVVASGGVEEDTVSFEFDNTWTGYTKKAVFYRDKSDVYAADIGSDNTAVIPWEVLQQEGFMFLGVFGTKGNEIKTSTVVRYRVERGAITAVSDRQPTPNFFEDIISNTAARHTHSNKDVIDGITAEQVAKWDGASGGIQMVKIGELPFTAIANETILRSDVSTILKIGGDNLVTSLEQMNVSTGNPVIDANMTAEYPDDYSVVLTSAVTAGDGNNHFKTYLVSTEIGKTYTLSVDCDAEHQGRICLGRTLNGVTFFAPGRYSVTYEATAETTYVWLYMWNGKTEGNQITYRNLMICEGENIEFSTGRQSFELTAGQYTPIEVPTGTLIPAVEGAVIEVYEEHVMNNGGGMTEEQIAQLAKNSSDIARNTAAISTLTELINELEVEISNFNDLIKPNAGINVFFGDSIPAFDANTGGIGAIPDYLRKKCGGTWHNFCVGGTTMSAYRTSGNGYEYFTLDEWADSVATGNFAHQEQGVAAGATAGSSSYSIANKVADAKALDWSTVKRIFLSYGTNDLAYGVSAVGNADDAAAKNGTMCAALKYAVQAILTAHPTIEIVVCGIIYRYVDGVSASEIIAANEAIRATCESIGVPFIPLFDNMGVNAWNRTSFLYDGTHPNANGKERYADVIRRFMDI